MPLTEKQRAELHALVNSKKVVLFMKGNRHFPACGFSATVIGILKQLTGDYETVNILEDQHIRNGMKEFSNWPTFPQLYVGGQFVGGCDIVKEMHEQGELAKLIGAEASGPVAPPRMQVSPAAAAALKSAVSDGGEDVLRLEIDPQFNCDLYVGPREDGDIPVAFGDLILHVARGSARRAEGIAIDFVATPKGDAFKIDNPNAPARVKGIDPKALKALLDAGKIELFDVRPDHERALASIAQAKKLDAAGEAYLLGLKKDAPVAFHCHHGGRSRSAGEQLLREGFTNVYNLEGGIEAWAREVDPSIPSY
jgi:monothiol glutaredoxin